MISYVLESYRSFSWVYPVICRVFISIPRNGVSTSSAINLYVLKKSILRHFFGGEGMALHELFQWSKHGWCFYIHHSLECILCFQIFFHPDTLLKIIPDWSRWLHETHFVFIPIIFFRGKPRPLNLIQGKNLEDHPSSVSEPWWSELSPNWWFTPFQMAEPFMAFFHGGPIRSPRIRYTQPAPSSKYGHPLASRQRKGRCWGLPAFGKTTEVFSGFVGGMARGNL